MTEATRGSTAWRWIPLAVGVVLAGVVLLSGSQAWRPEPDPGTVDPASGAPSALLALGGAALALLAALLLAGPFFRVALSILHVLIGVTVVAVAALGLGASSTGWPVLALVAGALQVVVGGILVAAVRRWPRPAPRYSRSRLAGDPWTDLDEGRDPTETRSDDAP